MTAGELIDYLEQYDRDECVEVHVVFDELDAYGGAEAVSGAVAAYSREELANGEANRWPTLTVGVGFGACTEDELRGLAAYFADVAARLARRG